MSLFTGKVSMVQTLCIFMKKNKSTNIQEIFLHSRFYYFKKHFGLFQAIMTEMILRINKYTFLLIVILALGFFLRVSNIFNTMPFLGDQAVFYLSARDMLLSGTVPLVGIESSHPWL